MGDLFFDNPKDAVVEISKLLSASDWKTLAKYYDLSNTDIDDEELTSGKFFIREERPEVAHPADFWRYKHPFSPGFDYFYSEPETEGKVLVWVKIEIDQGDGMTQVGLQKFRMRKSKNGYQLLP